MVGLLHTTMFPAAGIENDSQITEASGNSDVRRIGHPDHVWSIRDQVAVQDRVDV